MKKIITTALIALSLSASSQTDSTKAAQAAKAKEDSIIYVTKILSLQDIDRIMVSKKGNISVADWEIFWKVINAMLLPDAVKEYEAKKPKPKK